VLVVGSDAECGHRVRIPLAEREPGAAFYGFAVVRPWAWRHLLAAVDKPLSNRFTGRESARQIQIG